EQDLQCDGAGSVLHFFRGRGRKKVRTDPAAPNLTVSKTFNQITPNSLATLASLSRAKSICASVWVAMRLRRMSSWPGGTPGDTTGLMNTPSSCNRLLILNVTIKSRQ